VPECLPPADEHPSVAPAAPLTPGTHEAPSRDGL
jgi:hypothetical protein